MLMLILDETSETLFDPVTVRRFDPATRTWMAGPPVPGVPVTAVAAAGWLQKRSGHRLRQPIGVIGPRQASPGQLAAAEEIGAALAVIGFAVVCGGRQGVMEAVCRGVAAQGGISIGLLPEIDAAAANAYVTVPIATGIGEARNAIVARAAFCLIAIGDSHGTLSEVALGLQFGRPVLGLAGAPQVAGVERMASPGDAVARVAGLALGL
jgi:hypothetical protein